MRKVLVIALFSLSMLACAPRGNKSVTPVSAPVKLSQEEMQRNMMAAAEVRPEHAVLKDLSGNWLVETKMWMDPHAAPEVSKGAASSKLLFGGRYLVQDYKGSFMGQPFEGQLTMGFDNVNEKYFSTWIDSMSTMMMQSSGNKNAENQLVLASSMTCPMTREHLEGEDVITFIDKNHYRYEAYHNMNGQKNKAMEITYSRIR